MLSAEPSDRDLRLESQNARLAYSLGLYNYFFGVVRFPL